MPPPITSASTLRTRIFQQFDLGGDLGAADDRNHRLGRRFQRLVQRVEFGLHGTPGVGRQHVAKALGGGVRAMRRRESVVDPDVAELCQLRDKARVVLFFFFMKTRVFETKDIAVLHLGDGFFCATYRRCNPRQRRPAFRQPAKVRLRPAFSDSLGSRPLGRPKCASRMTLPPLSEISAMVGRDALKAGGVG